MDTLREIEILAKKAQMQKIPVFDVSDQVIEQLRADKANTINFVAFDFFAGILATAASIILYIGINAWMYIMNPLTQFFAPLKEIRLW